MGRTKNTYIQLHGLKGLAALENNGVFGVPVVATDGVDPTVQRGDGRPVACGGHVRDGAPHPSSWVKRFRALEDRTIAVPTRDVDLAVYRSGSHGVARHGHIGDGAPAVSGWVVDFAAAEVARARAIAGVSAHNVELAVERNGRWTCWRWDSMCRWLGCRQLRC